MQGQDTYQRSALTPNHAKYFIDTTVSAATQTAGNMHSVNKGNPNLLNVFRAGEKYYVFLLFAKPSTDQTYEIFVGEDDAAYAANPLDFVEAIQMDVRNVPYTPSSQTWPSTWPTPTYDSGSGILSVTMNMGFTDFGTKYDGAREHHCQPSSFCQWNSADGGKCVCNPSGDHYDLCKASTAQGAKDVEVCSWASLEVDCPEGGCYGFAVTLSDHFTTAGPTDYPGDSLRACFTKATTPGFDVPFFNVDTDLAGTCHYDSAPALDDFCAD